LRLQVRRKPESEKTLKFLENGLLSQQITGKFPQKHCSAIFMGLAVTLQLCFFRNQEQAMFSLTSPDSTLTLIFSVLLLSAGIGVVGYLCFLLCSALSTSFGGSFEQARFRRHSIRCQRGDALLEKGDLTNAAQAFVDAFFLKPIRHEASLLSSIANYHTGLLSRLLTVADELGKGRARLISLADTDRLLAERLEIQLEYFRALKQEETLPFHNFDHRLRVNEVHVRASLKRLLEEIRSSEERVLYH
jgi:hypothetical protein